MNDIIDLSGLSPDECRRIIADRKKGANNTAPIPHEILNNIVPTNHPPRSPIIMQSNIDTSIHRQPVGRSPSTKSVQYSPHVNRVDARPVNNIPQALPGHIVRPILRNNIPQEEPFQDRVKKCKNINEVYEICQIEF